MCLSFYTLFQLSLSRGHQTVAIMKHSATLLILFDGLQKVKAKYIVLCLNCPAKFQNARESSCYPACSQSYILAVSIQ